MFKGRLIIILAGDKNPVWTDDGITYTELKRCEVFIGSKKKE